MFVAEGETAIDVTFWLTVTTTLPQAVCPVEVLTVTPIREVPAWLNVAVGLAPLYPAA